MKNKNNKGFTLFELLVSISIIALLTTVAIVSFGGINKKARDSKRGADLEKVRIALEGYRQINGSYPADLATLVTAELLQAIPTDPKSSIAYEYDPGATGYTYYVCATVEITDSMSSDQSDCTALLDGGYVGYSKTINP